MKSPAKVGDSLRESRSHSRSEWATFSGVAARHVFRLEEGWEQAVHLQESLPRHLDTVCSECHVSLLGQFAEALAKALQDVNPELVLKVASIERTGLQLEDHLT